MDFITIDVETANPDLSSICQIGIAAYLNDSVVDEWKSYINPEDEFNVINIAIHGIDESTVINAPKLPEVREQIQKYLDKHVVVCHTHFDRVSISQAFSKYNMTAPDCLWLDSARVARRTWDKFAWSGYGLYNICEYLGYEFSHHDALEDAKAAGHILISAIKNSGIDLDSWLKRVNQPINLSNLSIKRERVNQPVNLSNLSINREGNPEGPLYGEIIVFTGTLNLRREAADMAAKIGCKVESGVNKSTTLLVVGDQDVRLLADHDKSLKQRKAEKLISEGQPIRILRETYFKELVNIA